MNLTSKYWLVAAAFCISTGVFAQKKEFDKAESCFKSGRYTEAIEEYKQATAKAGNNKSMREEITFKMAEAYRLIGNTKEAEKWYEKAAKTRVNDPQITLQLANIYRSNEKYTEAIAQYESYQKLNPSDPMGKVGTESCQQAEKLKAKAVGSKLKVQNIAEINSSKDDFAAAFADADLKTITFTSNRPGTTGGESDPSTSKSFSDVYTTKYDKKWSTPAIEKDLATESNDGTVAYNKDFSKKAFTRFIINKDKKNKGKERLCRLFYAEKSGENWSEPTELNLVEATATIGQPAFSPDGKMLFFVSDAGGGVGGKDVWYSVNEAGTWGTPMNAGNTVNTVGNEMFPFVSEDNVLYFSSDGHPGIGGWDIFSAQKSGSMFKNVQNLGAPFNSSNDDFGITFVGPSTKMKKGLFSSNRKDGKGGDDIYSFELPEVNMNLVVTVKDKTTQAIMPGAKVTINDGKDKIDLITDKDGKIFFKLKESTAYSLLAEKEEYLNDKGKVSTIGQEESKDYATTLFLQTTKTKSIKLPKILYDLNAANLRPESEDSLVGLYQTLADNPTIAVEIMSHTDCRASSDHNKKLSNCRARSVVAYLIEKGINGKRLIAKGYGETSLLNKCADGVECTEEEHEQNRRTEFKILRTDFDEAKEGKSKDVVVEGGFSNCDTFIKKEE